MDIGICPCKKTANSRWNFTWRRLCFIFDLILHNHTLLIITFNSQMKVWEMGLPQHWKKVSIHQAPKCFTNRRPEAAKKMPIKLNDLFGAFLILGLGLGLATLTFFTENIIMFYHFNHNV